MILKLYWKIKEKYLQKKYKNAYLPVKLKDGQWILNTKHGPEVGTADYIAGEFCGDNVVYNYKINGSPDHTHSFEGVIDILMLNPFGFSVKGFENEYSAQELRILYNLQERFKSASEK